MRIVSGSSPTPNVTRTRDLLTQVRRLTTTQRLVVNKLILKVSNIKTKKETEEKLYVNSLT